MMIRLVSVTCLLVTAVCNADIIGTDPIPPAFTLSGFGSSEVYRGQTFRLPSGPAIVANSLTVFVGPTTDVGANFRVLITEVDMTDGFHPTEVIFESETLNVPIFPLRSDPDAFVIDLGGLLLEPGRDYAWILDHFVVGNPGTFVSMDTGLGTYPDGMAFSFPNGPFFPSGTREDHFASNNWFIQGDLDFAFQLEFTGVVADSDADGVSDDQDQCPDTPPGAIVDAHGCSIDQLAPCDGPLSGGTWKNHGQYVSAVVKAAKEFQAAGLISEDQRHAIARAAAKSNCGKE